jgi:hypothetical protein
LEAIDFVGVTENIGAVVSTMAREMRYHPPLYFPVINDNPERIDPLLGLDEDDIQILREHNTIDLQLYEFAKKLISWRDFGEAMRQLVRDGIYHVPPESFEIQMADLIPGSGWYAPEHDDRGGVWRWTGPNRHFTIEVPLREDASYRFVLTFNDKRPSGLEDLAVEVNDVPIVFELWPESDRYRCEFIIDQALLARSTGFCRIRIDAGAPVRPGDNDLRLLGLLVRRIEFICLES